MNGLNNTRALKINMKKYADYSKEELIKEITALKKRKKYGLVWDEEREPEKVVLECREKLPVLKEVKDKEIVTDKNQPTNSLIEGDNYHALSVLNYTHKGKIDVIYIDPPYNTGNEGFVYNDKLVDLNDTYRHSKWLSFMEKRLKLAKNLLKDTGVIFISIDNNELAQLKLLCDNLFGEENFISLLIIQTNRGGRDYLQIATTHEYLLCYGRSSNTIINELPKDTTLFEFQDENGLYETRELRNRNPKFTRENRPNLFYPIYVNSNLKDKYGYCAVSLAKSKSYSIEALPKNSQNKDSCWRWSSQLVSKNIIPDNPYKSQVIAKQKKDEGWNIYEKSRKFTTKAKSIWTETDVRTELGTIVLRNIFGKSVFEHPKPVPLIKKIINLASNKDSIILDFFAGSGTTAQAILEVNKEDQGKRKFILCTDNQSNNGSKLKIATDICYPRIYKVIIGYKNLKKEKINGLGGNLKYFVTDFVDAAPTDSNKRDLVNKCTEMLCLRENAFELVKEGNNFRIFKDSKKYLGIIYDEDSIDEFKKEAKQIDGNFSVYVFSLDQYAHNEQFEDMPGKIKLNPIPEVILAVYRRIFK